MDGRELLNKAFGDIDDSFIVFAETPPVRGRFGVKIAAVAAACVAIIVAMLPFVMKIKDIEAPVVPDNGDCLHETVVVREEVPPTCESGGIRYMVCAGQDCDYAYTESFGEPLGHGEFTTVTVEGACLSPGYTAERCEDCGTDINKREFTIALVHDFQKDGDGYICGRCGCDASETEALDTHSQRLEAIFESDKTVLVNADINELELGTIASSYVNMCDNRFTLHVDGVGCVHSEIRKDSAKGDSYLRHTVRSGGRTANVAKVNGSYGDTVTVEFTVRLGSRDRNGDYVDWTAKWQAKYASATDTVDAASMDRDGVLSFANSQFSVRLSDTQFTRIRLTYRFSDNSYDIYVDGKLCDEGVRIVEGGDDATEGFKPVYFIYASTDSSADHYNGSFDLGGFIAYKE